MNSQEGNLPKMETTKAEKGEGMKNLIITVAMGLSVALAAGAAFGGEHGSHDSRVHAEAGQYESKVYGTIRSLPHGMVGIWDVNGREINVSKTTLIKEKHGKAELGAYVEVKGISSGNTLNAYKVEVKRDRKEVRKMRGTIESLSTGKDGKWIVNGEEIQINKDTFIKEKHGRAVVGAYVEVEGISSGNALSARKIEVKRARQ